MRGGGVIKWGWRGGGEGESEVEEQGGRGGIKRPLRFRV